MLFDSFTDVEKYEWKTTFFRKYKDVCEIKMCKISGLYVSVDDVMFEVSEDIPIGPVLKLYLQELNKPYVIYNNDKYITILFIYGLDIFIASRL